MFANPQPCGRCSDGRPGVIRLTIDLPPMPPWKFREKSQEAESTDVSQFVWVYCCRWAKAMSFGGRYDRSSYAGCCRFTVIGDRPP